MAGLLNDGATDEQVLQAMRVRELFHGRFSQNEALRLLEYFNWDLNEAIQFVFSEDPQRVRQVCGSGDDWQIILNNRVHRELALRNEIPFQVRQFACQPCDSMWWRRVPSRKMVSKCHRCKRRYDAVPKEREWGWARFTCRGCGHQYHAFAQMNNTWCPCYQCGTLNDPQEVLPPYKRARRGRRNHTHSCTGTNCFNRVPNADSIPGIPRNTICVHPKSLLRRAVSPSAGHLSTGSTISTILTQDDLQSFGEYEPSEPDISEGDEGD